jgi:hypothetical protein
MVLTVEITKEVIFSEGINLGYACAEISRANDGVGFTFQRSDCCLFGWNVPAFGKNVVPSSSG